MELQVIVSGAFLQELVLFNQFFCNWFISKINSAHIKLKIWISLAGFGLVKPCVNLNLDWTIEIRSSGGPKIASLFCYYTFVYSTKLFGSKNELGRKILKAWSFACKRKKDKNANGQA